MMKTLFLLVSLFFSSLAFGQHVKQLSPNGGGSLFDALYATPDHEAQFGLAYWGNKVFHVLGSGSTTTGDWWHSFAFPTGIESIGDADFSGPGATQLLIQINGNPVNWNRPGDGLVTALNWSANTLSSGSGFNVGVMRAGFGVSSASVASGGNGYAEGDLIAIPGASGPAPATARVMSVSGGAITSIKLHTSGEFITAPTNPVAVTSLTGTGTGATLNVTTSPKAVHALPNNSLSFMHVPANRHTGLIPGWGMLVANADAAHNRGIAFCAPSLSGFDAGNYSLLMLDWVNKKFRIPRWVAGAYQPSDVGWQDSLTVDPATGAVVISGTLEAPVIAALQAQVAALTTRLDNLLARLVAAGTEEP